MPKLILKSPYIKCGGKGGMGHKPDDHPDEGMVMY